MLRHALGVCDRLAVLQESRDLPPFDRVIADTADRIWLRDYVPIWGRSRGPCTPRIDGSWQAGAARRGVVVLADPSAAFPGLQLSMRVAAHVVRTEAGILRRPGEAVNDIAVGNLVLLDGNRDTRETPRARGTPTRGRGCRRWLRGT
jgi:hypothetical protein